MEQRANPVESRSREGPHQAEPGHTSGDEAAAKPCKEPQPPADAQRYVNKAWTVPKLLTDRSLAHPPPVVLTKMTLKSLFGWQYGSDREYCPTVVFHCTAPGGGAATELGPVQLLPPSRDDRDVEIMKRESSKRVRVDGYAVPTAVVKKLLAQLFAGASPAGRRLHFRSAGWRGTQLLLGVSHEAAEAAGAAGDMEAQEGEASQSGPQRSASGAAQSQSQASPHPAAAGAAAAAAAAAAATPLQQQGDPAAAPPGASQQQGQAAAAAAAAAAEPAVPAAEAADAPTGPAASTAAARQPAEEGVDLEDDSQPFTSPQAPTPSEVPAKQEARQFPSNIGDLAAATAEASTAGAPAGGTPVAAGGGTAGHPQPLMARLDSLQPAAQSTVQAAHAGWLLTDQVHQLMANFESLGVPKTEQQPIRPKAGDLFLADLQRRFDRDDGHDWTDRRTNKLKVDGAEVLQVVYFTTRDGKLQRRAYRFLPGCKAELAHLHLLHYQVPPGVLNSERPKPGPKKRESNGQSEQPAKRQAASQPHSPPGAASQQAQQAGQPGAAAQQAQQAQAASSQAAEGVLDLGPLDLKRVSRAEKIWRACIELVESLLVDQSTREIFGMPVNPKMVPEYYRAVKNPADLGSIKAKLLATPPGYSTPFELRDDVRLTFDNCRLFNPKGTSMYNLGEAASARFETAWTVAQVEARWEAHLRLCEQEEQQRQVAPAGKAQAAEGVPGAQPSESGDEQLDFGGRPAAQQAQQASAEQAAAQRQRQEALAAAEERKRQAATEAERKHKEAAEERQQKAAAEAARQRQQAAEEERQRQAQQQQQLGQKREREAAEGSEAPPGAKRPATAAEPHAQQRVQQGGLGEKGQQVPGKQKHEVVKLAPGASSAVDRSAAFRTAMPILQRAGVSGARYTLFLTKIIRQNNDDSEVADILALLKDRDAAGDAEAVCALVDAYLPQ